MIIVNDFGDISLDEKIIDSDDVITFDNGCVCCSLGDNLYEQLSRLLKDECDFEHIIVEASGISDPRSIADLAIAVDKVYLNDIYIFLDAENFLVRAQDHRLESIIKTQLDAATVLIMNKCDLSTHESKLSIYQWLHEYKLSLIHI